MSLIARLTLVLVSLCLVVPSHGEGSSGESASLAEVPPASYVDLYTPYFSVAGRDSTDLVFVTAVSEPVEVEITAFNAKGDPLPVGRFTIPVSQHLSLDLKTLVQPASGDFWQGSLRVSYIGSVETLQAWVLLGLDGQLTEFTLLARPEAPVNSLMTFWGTSHGAVDPRRALYLLNAGTRPVRYTTASSHRGMARERSRVIGAGERHKLVLAGSGPGWIRVDHDGNPGDLIGLSLDRGPSRARVVPVWTVPSEQVSTWETIRVPVVGSAGATTGALTLFNSADERVEAQIAVLADTGAEFLEMRVQLGPGEVQDVALSKLLGSVQESEVRLRVTGDRPGILVHGVAATPGGGLSELSFFAHDKAHASGTYPILPVDQYSTDVTLVNLGPDQSEVVVQFFWSSGTYALGPISVAAGASRRLSIDDVTAGGTADLLGRVLPERLENGFFKWKVHTGSRRLLGRAEISSRESGDRVGFNCLGCCTESPVGSIQPSSVEFDVGETPSFVACVTYQTCNGPMGPYEASPSSMFVPSPFSWNASTVGASSAAQEALSFLAWGEEVSSTCTTIEAPYGASGVANSCKLHLRKAHNPFQKWSATQACTQQVSGEPASEKCNRCNSCCDAQKAYATCKKVNQSLVQSEYNACIGLCLIDHCS